MKLWIMKLCFPNAHVNVWSFFHYKKALSNDTSLMGKQVVCYFEAMVLIWSIKMQLLPAEHNGISIYSLYWHENSNNGWENFTRHCGWSWKNLQSLCSKRKYLLSGFTSSADHPNFIKVCFVHTVLSKHRHTIKLASTSSNIHIYINSVCRCFCLNYAIKKV